MIAHWFVGLSIETLRVQIPVRAEMLFKILALPAPPSEFGYNEYTDHTLSLGGYGFVGEDRPPTIMCRGLENEVADISDP